MSRIVYFVLQAGLEKARQFHFPYGHLFSFYSRVKCCRILSKGVLDLQKIFTVTEEIYEYTSLGRKYPFPAASFIRCINVTR